MGIVNSPSVTCLTVSAFKNRHMMNFDKVAAKIDEKASFFVCDGRAKTFSEKCQKSSDSLHFCS